MSAETNKLIQEAECLVGLMKMRATAATRVDQYWPLSTDAGFMGKAGQFITQLATELRNVQTREAFAPLLGRASSTGVGAAADHEPGSVLAEARQLMRDLSNEGTHLSLDRRAVVQQMYKLLLIGASAPPSVQVEAAGQTDPAYYHSVELAEISTAISGMRPDTAKLFRRFFNDMKAGKVLHEYNDLTRPVSLTTDKQDTAEKGGSHVGA